MNAGIAWKRGRAVSFLGINRIFGTVQAEANSNLPHLPYNGDFYRVRLPPLFSAFSEGKGLRVLGKLSSC